MPASTTEDGKTDQWTERPTNPYDTRLMRGRRFAVRITLRDELAEDFSDLPFLSRKSQLDFKTLIDLFAACRQKRKIGGVFLVLKNVSLSWSQIDEIHQELDLLHKTGKRSLALLEEADNQSYYLACGAQQVYLCPTSNVNLIGLNAELRYYRDLLAWAGVEPQLYRIGDYKSASEPYMEREMSAATREMLENLLKDIQSRQREKIASGRGVEAETVQGWIDGGPQTAKRALEAGLVDDLLYEDEVEEKLAEGDPPLSLIPSDKIRLEEGFLKRLLTRWRPQLAYIVVDGLISRGLSRRGGGTINVAGSDTLRSFLKRARKSKRVKAVVLRINSPGGSALASDLVWRDVQRTAEVKPVIVSLGAVAASGGYYIAVGAAEVLAMPSTITGSIGVIVGKFNVGQLLAKLGVTVEALETGKHAGLFSINRPFSEEEAELVKEQMEHFYECFVERVAASRQLSIEQVDRLGQGRVWTGNQALGHKLVDGLGGLRSAIESARKQAGLAKYRKVRVVRYTRRRTLRELIPFPSLEALAQTRIWALLPWRLLVR